MRYLDILHIYYMYLYSHIWTLRNSTHTSLFALEQILARVNMGLRKPRTKWHAKDTFDRVTMFCLGNDLTTLLSAEKYESISLIHMIIYYYVSSVPRATKGRKFIFKWMLLNYPNTNVFCCNCSLGAIRWLICRIWIHILKPKAAW